MKGEQAFNVCPLGEIDDRILGVRWVTTTGTPYFLFVHGRREQTGSFDLIIDDSINDECQYALGPIELGKPITGTNVGAQSYLGTMCGNVTTSSSRNVWYTIEGTGGVVTAETTCEGTDMQSQLMVWTGSCDNLVCIAGSEPGTSCENSAKVTWTSSAGTLYYIIVKGKAWNEEGLFELIVRGET